MNKKIWVGVYVASFLLLLLASLVVGTILLLQMDQAAEFSYETISLVTALGTLVYLQFLVVQTIYNFMLLAKMWGAIQDGRTPVTVGKAIGFLFIPFFNIYWLFVAWGSFPTHYNNFIERHRLNAPRMAGGVFALLPVTILLAGILIMPILAMPLIFSFVIARVCDAVNELKAATAERQTGVVSPARHKPKPKSKLVPATIAAAVVVPLFLIFAFAVFAGRNMNPPATDAELPETVGKLKRHYPYSHGSIFGLRREYTASYKLPDEKTHSDYISYRMIDFTREADAEQRLKRWSYCSGAARKEGSIKDKNGGQIGEFVLCDGKRFYSKTKNRYVSVDSASSKFGLNDVIEFYAKLPFNQNLDAADLSAAVKGIYLPANSKSGDNQISQVSSSGGEKADITITAEEFFKDTGGYGASKNREKYAGKTLEISGRYYLLSSNSGESASLHVGTTNAVNLRVAAESQTGVASLKENQRVAFKCRAASAVTYGIALENCVLTASQDPLSAEDKPDFAFSAEDYYKQVEGERSYEAKRKKQELYAGKIIELTGRVKQIGDEKHYLEVENLRWVACKPDEGSAGQFNALTAGQEVKFKGVARYSGLEHCLVASQ